MGRGEGKQVWGKENEVSVGYGEFEALGGGGPAGSCCRGWSSAESWATSSATVAAAVASS